MLRIGALASCALVALSTAAIAGCTSSTAATATTMSADTIYVDSVPTQSEAGLYVAQYEGYFRQQGLNVIIRPVTGGEAAIPDLQSGAAQFVGGNYVSFILAQIDKSFNSRPASFRIVAAGSDMQSGTEALYVRKGSPYQTIAELARHHATIGLNTANDVGQVLLGALYQDAGFSFFKDARQVIPPQGFPALLPMLGQGKVDAAWLPQPFGTIAEQSYGAQALADFNSGATKGFPFTGYIGSTEWVQAHPQTVAAFVRALTQGQQVADTRRAIAEQAMAKYTKLPTIIADTMGFDNYPLTVSVPQLQRVPDEMFQFGLTDGLKSPFQIASMIWQAPPAA